MHSRLTLLLAGLLLFLAGCGGSSATAVKTAVPTAKPAATPTAIPTRDYTAVVSGTVVSAKSGKPIAGALLAVGRGPRRTRTNARGRYSLTFPAGVPAALSVAAKGYAGALAMGAKLKSHRSYRVDFKLNPKAPGHAGLPSPPTIFGP